MNSQECSDPHKSNPQNPFGAPSGPSSQGVHKLMPTTTTTTTSDWQAPSQRVHAHTHTRTCGGCSGCAYTVGPSAASGASSRTSCRASSPAVPPPGCSTVPDEGQGGCTGWRGASGHKSIHCTSAQTYKLASSLPKQQQQQQIHACFAKCQIKHRPGQGPRSTQRATHSLFTQQQHIYAHQTSTNKDGAEAQSLWYT
eukprot:scaffold4016_cov21-Tisochrysis_lutea.AAC.3